MKISFFSLHSNEHDSGKPRLISAWHIFLASFTGAALVIVAFFTWWNIVRPVNTKTTCADNQTNLYESQIKTIKADFNYNGFGGIEINSDSTSEHTANQTEIDAKDNYFSCLKSQGIN